MNDDTVIWGTRAMGNIAYYYYKDKCNVLCYVDNHKQKWGEKLNGLDICSPEILHNMNVRVVLAMKHGIEDIQKQLREEFNIHTFTVFQVNEELHSANSNLDIHEEVREDTCIVSFSGGLGNQMFQYALLRNLDVLGKNVMADLEKYARIGIMEFQLTDVFENIRLKLCTEEQKNEVIKKNMEVKNKPQKFIRYIDSLKYGGTRKADLSLLDITSGVIDGLHQTYRFAERIRDILLDDFRFNSLHEKKLSILREEMMNEKAVSIHIRRGDYLLEKNKWRYGEICTREYYINAINYIKEKVGHCIFYFFSNDIEWVEQNYKMEDAVYVEKKMFEDYKDWYDMYLMSICEHNIIANSTFSWWGAWLNQNENKIVIAPKNWINMLDCEDICPDEWIRLSEQGEIMR